MSSSHSSHPSGPPRRAAFGTRTIHAGQTPDPTTGAIMVPISVSSTYVQQAPGVNKGFDYGRSQNPTRFAFERCVADLEDGKAAFAFASGLAAIATTLELLDHGAARRRLRRSLRRVVSPLRERPPPHGQLGFQLRRRQRSGRAGVGHSPGNPHVLDGKPLQSAAEAGRSGGHRGLGEAPRPADGRRQHLRLALLPAPLDPGLRRGGPLDDQVHQRPFGHHRRRGGGGRECRVGGEAAVPAKRGGGHQRTVRLLPRLAGTEDPLAAHGAALPERPATGPVARRPAGDRAGDLSGPGEPSATRPGPPADERLRRHDRGGAGRRPGANGAVPRPLAASSPWPKVWAAWKAWSNIPP